FRYCPSCPQSSHRSLHDALPIYHRAAAEAALYAIFPSAESRPIFPELLAEGLEPHHVNEVWMTLTNQPDVFVDITDVHEIKLNRSEEHTSELQSRENLVCRLLLE